MAFDIFSGTNNAAPAPSKPAAPSSGTFDIFSGSVKAPIAPALPKPAPVSGTDTTGLFSGTLKSLGLNAPVRTANSTAPTMAAAKPPAPKAMNFEVGAGLTPEGKQAATNTIDYAAATAPGQTIKAPYLDAGIDVPASNPDQGGIGGPNAVYDQFKSFVEAPEKSGRSLTELVGASKPDSSTRKTKFVVPSYAETAGKDTAQLMDEGVPPTAAVILTAGAVGGQFANDALMYEGILSAGARAIATKTAAPAESHLVAWDFLGRPKTMADAEANWRAFQKEYHPDLTGDDTISKQANNAITILRKDGIPSTGKISSAIDTLTKRPVQDLFKGSQLPSSVKPGTPIRGYLEDLTAHDKRAELLNTEIKTALTDHGSDLVHQALIENLGIDASTADRLLTTAIQTRTPAELKAASKTLLAKIAPETITVPESENGVKKDQSPAGAETGTPSNSKVAQRVPGTGSSLPSPKRKTAVGTEGRSELPYSKRYIAPSKSTNLSGVDDIQFHITTLRETAQTNKPTFEEHIKEVTGKEPAVRVKEAKSLEGKIERTIAEGKKIHDINDVLGSRLTMPKEESPAVLTKLQEHFDVQRVKDYNSKPSEWGYRGANVVVNLPNHGPAEIQLHSPESLEIVKQIHPIYEKWRNKDLSQLTPDEMKEYAADKQRSNDISKEIWDKGKQPEPVAPGTPRVPKLTERLEQTLQRAFEEVPTYESMNMQDQAQQAAELVAKDYDQAKRIALGQEPPPGELRVGTVFKAVEQQAIADGDIELLRMLGTSSTTKLASAFGQEVKAFDGRDPFSPVQAMTDIQAAREAAFEKRVKNTTAKKAKASEKARIKKALDKTAPQKEDWNSFIDSITC